MNAKMPKMHFEETTGGIRVLVEPSFLDDQSEPAQDRYVWAYHITIENKSAETVQLISRHWRIMDSHGRLQEFQGPGVVGEQPTIAPGHSYEYTSGAPLVTPSGTMSGSYKMRKNSGENFDVSIPLFVLDSPYDARRLH